MNKNNITIKKGKNRLNEQNIALISIETLYRAQNSVIKCFNDYFELFYLFINL